MWLCCGENDEPIIVWVVNRLDTKFIELIVGFVQSKFSTVE